MTIRPTPTSVTPRLWELAANIPMVEATWIVAVTACLLLEREANGYMPDNIIKRIGGKLKLRFD
jgi:hypothetical protein